MTWLQCDCGLSSICYVPNALQNEKLLNVSTNNQAQTCQNKLLERPPEQRGRNQMRAFVPKWKGCECGQHNIRVGTERMIATQQNEDLMHDNCCGHPKGMRERSNTRQANSWTTCW